MQALKTLIDHKLRVRVSDLPDDALAHVCEALSIQNLEREKAKKMDQWGWQRMPERIELFKFDTDMRGNTRLVMPRGFLGDFATGMEIYGLNVELVDHRSHATGGLLDYGGEGWRIFPWQRAQMEKIEAWEQGIVKSPAGSGKTLMILMTIQAILVRSSVATSKWARSATANSRSASGSRSPRRRPSTRVTTNWKRTAFSTSLGSSALMSATTRRQTPTIKS
jgi:hypothetical protein